VSFHPIHRCAFRLQYCVILYNRGKYYEKSLSGVGYTYTELPVWLATRGEKELLANAHIIHRGGWDVHISTEPAAIPSRPKDYTKWRAVLIFELRLTTTGHWLQGRQGQAHKT
jgi:hypothetical protein